MHEHSQSLSLGSKELVLQEAARTFAAVRDVPYMLGLDGDPKKLFQDGAGNCTRKHLYLVSRLRDLGYQITLGIAEFDWRELPIPEAVLRLLKDPIDTHLFLYASYDDEEMVVDATWDPGMPEGFMVNTWGGFGSVQIGVPQRSIRRMDYRVLQTRAALGSILRRFRQDQRLTPFNDAFNSWLGRRI